MMLQNPRRQRSFKKKIIVFLLLTTMSGLLIFFIYSLYLSSLPLFISPMGESNIDVMGVKKILKDKNILFSDVLVLSDSSYSVTVTNSGQVRISSKKDIMQQIASLQRILRELTIEGKPFKSIDFRFAEPIVSF